MDEIEKGQYSEFCDALIECMLETEDCLVRNRIALTLSALGCPKAVSVLIRLVCDPKLSNYNGTLLYALEKLDYKDYIEDLINLLAAESFETRLQSYLLIEKVSSSLSQEKRNECYQILTTMITKANEKLAILNDVIEQIASTE